MIVVDASAFVELLTDERGLADVVRAELMRDSEWAVPEHLVVEVASALRGLWIGRRCTDSELDARLAALTRLELSTFAVVGLLPLMRPLLHNTAAYDAAYLVLAELLDAPLLTLDAKLHGVPGSGARVRVIEPGR